MLYVVKLLCYLGSLRLEYEGGLAHEDHSWEQHGAGGDVDSAEPVSEQQGGEEDCHRRAGEDDAQGVRDSHQGHAGQRLARDVMKQTLPSKPEVNNAVTIPDIN